VTSATAPTIVNACIKQAAATPLKGKLLMPMIHGPALPVSTWTKMEKKSYPLLSEKRDCGGFMEPNLGARRITKLTWKLQAEPQKLWRANQITAPNLSQPAPDKHLNDLQKQGFSATQQGNTYQPYNVDLRNKVSFDIQSNPPTHRLAIRPQDIVNTGSQPLISWGIKKRVPYPPQMTLCFLKCTLTQ